MTHKRSRTKRMLRDTLTGIRAIFQKKLVKNWSSLFISMIVSSASSFLCFAILGNKMSIHDYGLFSTMIALATTVSVFVNNVFSGIVINREIAVEPDVARNLLLKFLWVRIIAFLFGTAALFIYTQNDADITRVVFISLVVLLSFESFWDLFEQVAFGLKITKCSMILNVVSAIVWLIAVAVIPSEIASIYIVLPTYAFICLSKTLVYGVIDAKITQKYSCNLSNRPFKYLLFSSMPYMYNRVLGIISSQLPIILLDGYSGLEETAYYSVGEKFATPISKLTTVTISAVFPFLTRALKKDHGGTGQIVIKLFQIILSCGACGAFILCSTSKLWLVAIFGEKYAGAVEAFNYQIWYAVIVSVDSVLAMALSSDFKQKTLSIITTIDAFVLIPFLYVGIRYGAKGVAMAKLIAAMFCVFYHLFVISRIFSNNYFRWKLLLSWGIFFVLTCVGSIVKSNVLLAIVAVISLILTILLNAGDVKKLIHMGKNSR